jgi:hypothetical protein
MTFLRTKIASASMLVSFCLTAQATDAMHSTVTALAIQKCASIPDYKEHP